MLIILASHFVSSISTLLEVSNFINLKRFKIIIRIRTCAKMQINYNKFF